MEKMIITEPMVKEMTEWARELAFDISMEDGERPRVYATIMEGLRIALLTVAENPGEAEDLLKEWWEWK